MTTHKPLLVVQPAFVGDLILTGPFLRALRRHHVGSEVHLLVRSELESFARDSGWADRVWPLSKKDTSARNKTWTELRGIQWGRVYCPHRSLRSAFQVSRLQAEERIGYRAWWNRFFFDRRVPRPMDLPEVLRLLALLPRGVEDSWDQYRSPRGRVDFEIHQSLPAEWKLLPPMGNPLPPCDPRMGARSHWLVLAPGSVWPTKRWTAQGFQAVARHFLSKGWGIVWTGAPNERELALRLASEMGESDGQWVAAGELDIVQTLQVMSRASLVLAGDSGATHMACAMGTPVVTVFGSTTPDMGYGPWSNRAVVVQEDLPCRPCGSHGRRTCPLGTLACMTSISADRVVRALEKLMEEINSKS